MVLIMATTIIVEMGFWRVIAFTSMIILLVLVVWLAADLLLTILVT